jgi:hypothetical protein
MSFTDTVDIKLGPSKTGLTLEAQLKVWDANTSAWVDSGGLITSGFAETGAGNYTWRHAFADGFDGLAVFQNHSDHSFVVDSVINPPQTVDVALAPDDIASVWAYANRTLTSGVVQLVNPWQVGTIMLIKGNSYLNSDSTAIGITKQASTIWPSDLLSAGDYTITFACTPTQKTANDVAAAAGFTTTTGVVVSATSIRLGDMAASITSGLTIPKSNGTNAYTYEVTASRSTGTIVHTLERGMLSVG